MIELKIESKMEGPMKNNYRDDDDDDSYCYDQVYEETKNYVVEVTTHPAIAAAGLIIIRPVPIKVVPPPLSSISSSSSYGTCSHYTTQRDNMNDDIIDDDDDDDNTLVTDAERASGARNPSPGDNDDDDNGDIEVTSGYDDGGDDDEDSSFSSSNASREDYVELLLRMRLLLNQDNDHDEKGSGYYNDCIPAATTTNTTAKYNDDDYDNREEMKDDDDDKEEGPTTPILVRPVPVRILVPPYSSTSSSSSSSLLLDEEEAEVDDHDVLLLLRQQQRREQTGGGEEEEEAGSSFPLSKCVVRPQPLTLKLVAAREGLLGEVEVEEATNNEASNSAAAAAAAGRNEALNHNLVLSSKGVVVVRPQPLTPKLVTAREGLLHSIAVGGGETTTTTSSSLSSSPEFNACLEILQQHYYDTSNCADDDNGGIWLSLNKPAYYYYYYYYGGGGGGKLGVNENGEPIYELSQVMTTYFGNSNSDNYNLIPLFNVSSSSSIICSVQGDFTLVNRVVNDDPSSSPPIIPKWLKEKCVTEKVTRDECWSTYNIVTAFTVESSSSIGDNASNYCNNVIVRHPIRGVMTTFGYSHPDPQVPFRHLYWFTGCRIERANSADKNNDEEELATWKHIFNLRNHQSSNSNNSLSEKAKSIAKKLFASSTAEVRWDGGFQQKKGEIKVSEDGSMEYMFPRDDGAPTEQHFFDTVFVDKSLRVIRTNSGTRGSDGCGTMIYNVSTRLCTTATTPSNKNHDNNNNNNNNRTCIYDNNNKQRPVPTRSV